MVYHFYRSSQRTIFPLIFYFFLFAIALLFAVYFFFLLPVLLSFACYLVSWDVTLDRWYESFLPVWCKHSMPSIPLQAPESPVDYNIVFSFPFNLKSLTLYLVLELFISVLFNFQIFEGFFSQTPFCFQFLVSTRVAKEYSLRLPPIVRMVYFGEWFLSPETTLVFSGCSGVSDRSGWWTECSAPLYPQGDSLFWSRVCMMLTLPRWLVWMGVCREWLLPAFLAAPVYVYKCVYLQDSVISTDLWECVAKTRRLFSTERRTCLLIHTC